MKALRILADDLTGALDSAAAFGAGVPVHLGRPPAAGGDATPVSVLATASRDVPPGQLPALLAPAFDWFAQAGLAFKKVDSLLRGNTHDEVALLARRGGYERVVFAPAFPSQGRVTREGRQWLLRDGGPPQPVGGPSIAEAMRERGFEVGIDEPVGAAAHAGPTVWVPDVRDDADLRRIAERSLAEPASRWLWCGSAGLAQALAGVHRLADRSPPSADEGPRQGPVLLVSASWQPVSREQWAVMLPACGDAVVARGGDVSVLSTALQKLAESATGLGLFDLALADPQSPDAAAALLARQLEAIAASAPRPRLLIVVGGDTLLALCRAVGAQTLRSEPALPRPGWGSARLIGGRWDGTRCHTRSGAFGGPDDLLAVLRAVQAPGLQLS